MASRKADSVIFASLLLILLFTISLFVSNLNPSSPSLPLPASSSPPFPAESSPSGKIAPKIFIIGFYDQESNLWIYDNALFDLSTTIPVPGLSPLFPSVLCSRDGQICHMVTGEGEINSAVSATALLFSQTFDLTHTYFLLAGVAGINPRMGSIGSVTFARFVVQPSLQYEFDSRDKPENFTTGYVPLGVHNSSQYPTEIYGTEVFELNTALRDLAVGFARQADLEDTDESREYKKLYEGEPGEEHLYGNAAQAPFVLACDTATSDTFVAGKMLGEAWGNYTHLVTNGQGIYCTTAEEDSAVLEALVRAHLAGLVDFGRTIVMRSGSDYDRPPEGMGAAENLWHGYEGYVPALRNLYIAGGAVIEGILGQWEDRFEGGVQAENYIGDNLGSLGGHTDFGPDAPYDPENDDGMKK